MKSCIIIKCSLIFICSFNIPSFADELLCGELLVNNYSGQTIIIKLYPVSMVFNGFDDNGMHNYDLKAQYSREDFYNYINGANIGGNLFTIPGYIGSYIQFNHDYSSANNCALGAIGYGRYKLEVWQNNGEDLSVLRDTCTIEWDNDFFWHGPPYLNDLSINIRLINGVIKIADYQWTGYNLENLPTDKFIKSWEPDANHHFNKNFGNFKYDYTHGNNYTIFPQDSRRDCGGENQVFEDKRSGLLTLNLTIDKNVNTPTTGQRYDYPITHITVLQGSKLTINPERTLTILSTYNEDSFYTYLNNYGTIHLKPVSAKIIVDNYNYFNLYSNSLLKIEQNSDVIIKPYGKLCNYGGRISNSGRIIFEGGRDRCADWQDFIIDDSTQIILEDSASWELEAGSTITLEGGVTCLRMKPGSQIKFGENSKLILKNGAHIIADNATFTSLNAGETWDGIYLEDVSNDTIKYCTIENAINGVNIINKTASIRNELSDRQKVPLL